MMNHHIMESEAIFMKTKIIICVLIFAFFLSGSYSEIVDEQLKIAEKSGFSKNPKSLSISRL